MYVTASYTFKIDKPSFNLYEGEKLYFRLREVASSTSNTIAYFNGTGKISISSNATQLGYAPAYCNHFQSASTSADSNINEIVFSQAITTFHDNGYIFVPNPSYTGSTTFPTSSLYDSAYGNYGDVDYPWAAKPQDIVVFQLSDKTYFEARIINVYNDSQGFLRFVLDKIIPKQLKDDIAFNSGRGFFRKFLVLTRLDDETSLYLKYSKRAGSTSYGFLIPHNLAPDILNNIDKITSQVKQKLLADQQGTISQ